VWKLAEHYLNLNVSGFVSGLIPILIMFAGILVAILITKSGKEELEFKEAARTGVIISVFTALVMGGYVYTYCVFLNPNYLQQYVTNVITSMTQAGYTVNDIEQQVKVLREASTVGRQVFLSITVTLVVGMIFSFIAAGWLTKKTG